MSAKSKSGPGQEIVSTRIFPAAPAKVFGAFSDPAQLAQWWGPKGFSNTFQKFEFRPGGAWKFTMRGPDGATYAMDHVFSEIVPGQRIVLNHMQPGHDFTLTTTFAGRKGGTELTWRMRFADPAEGEKLRTFLLGANEQNFDRLEALLAGWSFPLSPRHEQSAPAQRY